MTIDKEIQQNKKDLNRKAAIAGAFFVFTQLLVRGVTFLATPLYTRLLSTAQYGEVRVYESWLLIIVPVLSLSLYKSVTRAKFDFKNEYNEYVSSVQGLSYFVIAGCFLIITLLFRNQVMTFMGLDILMYVYLILYTFAYTSIWYYQTRERQMLRYRKSVTLTVCMMLPATVLSIILLFLGNKSGHFDKLVDLRVIGYYSPQIIGGLVVAFIIWRQGNNKIDRKYWKYALAFSLPLIPETLSIQIMNQSDKIMIQKMAGNESTGIFALATTISFIIWIIEDAVWGAWLPWLYEKIDRKEISDIQKPWTYMACAFGYFSWALVIMAPELISILGGSKYREAIYLVSPMVTGTLFRFFGYSFTAVENYQKKTAFCGLGTMIAMVINVILNAICIKYIGYQAAAYTTAASYFILLIIQGFLEKKVCGMRCVSLSKTLLMSLAFWGINEITMFTFDISPLIRFLMFIAISVLVLIMLYPGIKTIINQLRK